MSDPIENKELLEIIRTSHCANKGAGHRCVGQCTITSAGYELDCKLCGKEDGKMSALTMRHARDRLSGVASALGVDLDKLSDDTIIEAVQALIAESCPGCGAPLPMGTLRVGFLNTGYSRCRCGEWLWEGRTGWRRAQRTLGVT